MFNRCCPIRRYEKIDEEKMKKNLLKSLDNKQQSRNKVLGTEKCGEKGETKWIFPHFQNELVKSDSSAPSLFCCLFIL